MRVYLLFALLLTVAFATQAGTAGGTITFSGRIIDAQQTSQSTVVTPQTDSQTNQTTYVVTSKSTGRVLASFNTQADANQFVARLNPSVPYQQ